ncbi:MAG: terminase large subunit domain-containing protein [Mycobacterium sp.]
MVGGYGSGKTMIGSKWAINMALKNAPAPFAVVSPTFPVARETTISTLTELLDGKQHAIGAQFSYAHNKSEHVFYIRYGKRRGKIIVYSGEYPDRLKGPNLCGALIDEPFIQDQAVFDQIMARARHPRAKEIAIGLTGTPEQLNWGADLLEGEMAETHDVGFVRAPTKNNKALPPDYEERLREKYDEKTASAYLDGHFIDLSRGQVYHAFDATENVQTIDRPEGSWLVCGMDFNVDPMAFCVAWTTGERTHIIREYEQPNSDTEYACSTLRRDFPELGEIYPDASCRQRQANSPGGVTSLKLIRDAGFHANVPPQNPLRFDRYATVNGAFRHGKLSLDPSCTKLIGALKRYTHERMNKDDHKRMSHGLDALGYVTCGLHPIDRMEGRFGTY